MLRKININSILISALLIAIPLSFLFRYFHLSNIDNALKAALIIILMIFSIQYLKGKYFIIYLIIVFIYLIENIIYKNSIELTMWLTGVIGYLIIIVLPKINEKELKLNPKFLNLAFFY